MRFNSYVWNLYAESPEGQRTIAVFERIDENRESLLVLLENLNLSLSFLQDTSTLDFAQPHAPRDPEEIANVFGAPVLTISISQSVAAHATGQLLQSPKDAANLFESIIREGVTPYAVNLQGELVKLIEPQGGESTWEDFDGITLGLYMSHPDFFLPYFFKWHFDRIIQICDVFGIPLPDVPPKRDKYGLFRQIRG